MHIHMDKSVHVYFGKGMATAKRGKSLYLLQPQGNIQIKESLDRTKTSDA